MERTLDDNAATAFFQAYLDGSLGDDEGKMLLSYLETNRAFEAAAYDNLFIEYLLRHQGGSDPLFPDGSTLSCAALVRPPEPEKPSESPPFRPQGEKSKTSGSFSDRFHAVPGRPVKRSVFKRRFVQGAVLCFVLVTLGLFAREYARFHRAPRLVAHLTGVNEAVVEGNAPAAVPGDAVFTGTFRLRGGSVSLKMLDGAELVLEGPAEVRFKSRSTLSLLHGYLSADVPPQKQQFRIDTPQMTIKVLGTAFWIRASRENSEVHLVRGRLEIGHSSFQSFQLESGEAFSFSRHGVSQRLAALEGSFLGAGDRIFKHPELPTAERPEAVSDGDRTLLAHLDFSQVGRTVENRAPFGSRLMPSVQINGCSRVAGPDGRPNAVAFRDTDDRIRLRLDRLMSSCTISCRIRITSEIETRHSILASNEEVQGAFQWIVTRGGMPVLNINNGPKTSFLSFSGPKVFTGSEIGRWVRLALVVDGNRISWYADGRLLQEQRAGEMPLLFLGEGVLGGQPESLRIAKEKSGLDLADLKIYNRALSPEEIAN